MELIQEQKLYETQLQAIVMVNAMGTAFGTIKAEDFRKFVEQLTMKKKNVDNTIAEIKASGIPFEEH